MFSDMFLEYVVSSWLDIEKKIFPIRSIDRTVLLNKNDPYSWDVDLSRLMRHVQVYCDRSLFTTLSMILSQFTFLEKERILSRPWRHLMIPCMFGWSWRGILSPSPTMKIPIDITGFSTTLKM